MVMFRLTCPYRYGNKVCMKLQDYLQLKDLPRPDFAARIGVSEASLARYMNGTRIPRRQVMEAIARETDGLVTSADFFGDEAPRRFFSSGQSGTVLDRDNPRPRFEESFDGGGVVGEDEDICLEIGPSALVFTIQQAGDVLLALATVLRRLVRNAGFERKGSGDD